MRSRLHYDSRSPPFFVALWAVPHLRGSSLSVHDSRCLSTFQARGRSPTFPRLNTCSGSLIHYTHSPNYLRSLFLLAHKSEPETTCSGGPFKQPPQRWAHNPRAFVFQRHMKPQHEAETKSRVGFSLKSRSNVAPRAPTSVISHKHRN